MRYHEIDAASDLLVPLIISKKLIPIFGSGFSCGEKTDNGLVPNGKGCRDLFDSLLTKYEGSAERSPDLMDVSEELFRGINHKRIPVESFVKILKKNFTKVKLLHTEC